MKRIFRRIFIVLECKEDEYEGIGVTYFAFMEEILDVFWPWIYLKKGKVIKELSIRTLELRRFMFRGGQYFLLLCLQEGRVDNF